MATLNNTTISGNARVNGLLSTPALTLNGTAVTLASSVNDNNGSLVTAAQVKSYIESKSVNAPTISGNTVSWSTGWITGGTSTITAGTLEAVVKSAGETGGDYANYTEDTVFTGITSEGWLIINAGYFPNTKISLARLIANEGAASTDPSNGSVLLAGYDAYTEDGIRIEGTIPQYTFGSAGSGINIISSTYYTEDNTGFGKLVKKSYINNENDLYIKAGSLSVPNSKNVAVTLSGANVSNSNDYIITATTADSITVTTTPGWQSSSNRTVTLNVSNSNDADKYRISAASLTLTGSKSATTPTLSEGSGGTVALSTGTAIVETAPASGSYLAISATAPATTGISVSTKGTLSKGYLNSESQVTATGSTTASTKTYYLKINTTSGTLYASSTSSVTNAIYGTTYQTAAGWDTAGSKTAYIINPTLSGTCSSLNLNSGTITSVNGTGTITNLGNSTTSATLNITNNTYGTININGGKTANHGVSIEGYKVIVDGDGTSAGKQVTDVSGDLILATTGSITGGNLTWTPSNVTLSDTNNGISVTSTRGSESYTRSEGWLASSTDVTRSSTAETKYISGITVPANKSIDVTLNGSMIVDTNWTISKNSNDLVFTYSGS